MVAASLRQLAPGAGARRLMPAVSCMASQRRHLTLPEHKGFAILKSFYIPVPKHELALSVAEVAEKSKSFTDKVVIKAGAKTDGRLFGHIKENGHTGGVIITSPAEAADVAEKMIGNTLVTKHTGEAGVPVEGVLLVEKLPIAHERAIAIFMDKDMGKPVIVGSKVAGKKLDDRSLSIPSYWHNSDVFVKHFTDDVTGITQDEAQTFVWGLGFEYRSKAVASTLLMSLCKVFMDCKLTKLLLNPIADLENGKVKIVDAKLEYEADGEAILKEKLAKLNLS